MPEQRTQQHTIYTVTANCQDCYRCVRACPVKAIRVSGGQAKVDNALCIKCGTCIRECPQHAKTILSTVENAKALLLENSCVVASIAPSFAAEYREWRTRRLPSALRKLGFKYVAETAEGASFVTEKSFANGAKGSVCTACPAVVNYVEKYMPSYLDVLMPIVSPMVAHGRMLKQRYPGCAVVFIGPCAAKKEEAERPEHRGAVDVVLTFEELDGWLEDERIELANCSESGFDSGWEVGDSRLFPIQGGMLKTGNIKTDATDAKILHISGAEDILDLFQKEVWDFDIVEPLFCKGGCINGPAFRDERSLYERRADIINYTQKSEKAVSKKACEIQYETAFEPNMPQLAEVTQNQIDKVWERTGKTDPELRLNCGACGYKSCEDNAIAVVRGLAEPEMCMPYMRRLAQQRTDRIIETTPIGIVILDSELNIINMNPAFKKMFMCNNGVLGRQISYLINAEGFESLTNGRLEQCESIQTKYGIKYHEMLYALREERQYVGIYSDISKLKFDPSQQNLIKSQTLKHAQEFLDHQIRFSQEMAHFLGKSTAQSEEMVGRLMNLYEDVEDKEPEETA